MYVSLHVNGEPLEILLGILYGVDMFESNYPLAIAK
jgi:queuine/archaeosine tRNA-ribosyltransferase